MTEKDCSQPLQVQDHHDGGTTDLLLSTGKVLIILVFLPIIVGFAVPDIGVVGLTVVGFFCWEAFGSFSWAMNYVRSKTRSMLEVRTDWAVMGIKQRQLDDPTEGQNPVNTLWLELLTDTVMGLKTEAVERAQQGGNKSEMYAVC
ncbi:hypothetical protein ACH5RR_011048 [Cinchona calisaya]|uniref:Uncharacterized protein n=1 Tax=Cinchona calisaya TaxID=153742 RepID=A0ABD3A3S7_9GENT